MAPAPDGEAFCRLRGDALRGIVAFRREALTLQVLDRFQNRRRASALPAKERFSAEPASLPCVMLPSDPMLNSCVAPALLAPSQCRETCVCHGCHGSRVPACYRARRMLSLGISSQGVPLGRVAGGDHVAAELTGPDDSRITAAVADRGSGVYTLVFTVNLAGVWSLLPAVRAKHATPHRATPHSERIGCLAMKTPAGPGLLL